MRSKIQKFVDYLIRKTKDGGIFWRQSSYGKDIYTTYISKEKTGQCYVELETVESNGGTKDRQVLRLRFQGAPHIAPVSFVYTNIDIRPLARLDELAEAVIEASKPPRWLDDWIENIIRDAD